MSPLLETRALSRTFGGLEAVRAVDFRVARGEIRALIGPNGAGKTTLVNMISGRIHPTAGRILFEGREITRASAWRRVALGIAYTFQLTSVFDALTVHDNVALAVQRRLTRGVLDRLVLDRAALARRVAAALAAVGLTGMDDRPAAALPHGHRKLLEVAMGLALEPTLLILDEPTQGLAQDEARALCRLIREIARGVTVLLIEHNMEVVMGLAGAITVMDKGAILAEGRPDEIEANPDVQRAYLGG